ncbi:MAG TPA: potassium transporter Kef, partial [Bacteroidales bacterium]|nr:potassium transporter Kef [Bacteroidales bacterium]
MAVVYSVMLEYGLNKTVVFVAVTILLSFILPPLTNFLTDKFGYKTAAIRTKWILFVLISMAVLALWSGSEPLLPAYVIGMILAKTVEKDNFFVRRLRTMTIGFLTPFYFLRAGAL